MQPSSHPSLNQVECPICIKSKTEPVYNLTMGNGGERKIVRCQTCGLLFVSPRISSEKIVENYTGKSYFEREDNVTGYKNYLQDRDLHVAFFQKQLTELEKLTPKGKLLDVGCAGGFLLEEASKRGWQAEGVELSTFASDYARDTLGQKVTTCDLRGAAFPADSFRAIVMDDVIEHFEDPLVEAKEVWRILEPGGLYLLHTPNAGSLWRPLMGKRWIHLKPDEHLFYFNPQTITRLLEKAGFEVVSAKACGKATNLNYIVGVIGKILPWFADFFATLFGKQKFWHAPFSFRGGGMQVFARKPKT